ncbi:hypothetical protein PQE75_gp133 [Bacillus phage vB_BcoS-136]|uniref:Uncharacterized protein n=1 Tax=Bacillus phage vB_BcoS-136 TaxID=2419619 RepID=A0A3G3BW64_9CAUD|nr:hypothetical protein PQE75_gp133 [Bacillus phage vB_BcoS-136]AYP68346.1 hypothetical protein vBBcoS136_00232 [Bacillus phage vB_BcoS-136]
MFNFHVVVRHEDTGVFSSLNYKTDNEILTESDLINIEKFHADKSHGITRIKAQIISWQRLNT